MVMKIENNDFFPIQGTWVFLRRGLKREFFPRGFFEETEKTCIDSEIWRR